MPTRAGLYGRVSTADQSTDLQMESLRQYAQARSWIATEFTDQGVSGAKERRPALDALVAAARGHMIVTVLCRPREPFEWDNGKHV